MCNLETPRTLAANHCGRAIIVTTLLTITTAEVNAGCNIEEGTKDLIPCGGPDSFINLCGLCVGGNTGRAVTEGLDQCQVCHGSNSCMGCDGMIGSGKIKDACGACLEPNNGLFNNCTKITSITPNILDKAVDKTFTVSLRGAGLNPSNLPDVKCVLNPSGAEEGKQVMSVEKTSIEDEVIQLEIILGDQLGMYQVECTSSTVGTIDSHQEVALKVVNSEQLCVTDAKPLQVKADKEFQMTLIVPNLRSSDQVVCFVRWKESASSEIIEPENINDGKVKCGGYVVQRAGILEWGIAYTWIAAIDGGSCSSLAQVVVTASPPKAMHAEFFDSLRKVRITFDHNVYGSDNCSDIFATSTLTILGEGASCSFTSNSLIIALGSNSRIQPNSELELLNKSRVLRTLSNPALSSPASGKVVISPLDTKENIPRYTVIAPKFICSDETIGTALGRTAVMSNYSSNTASSSIRLVPSGGQNLKYNWSVFFKAEKRDQRHNLNVWKSVRMFQRHLQKIMKSNISRTNQIPINTSVLMEGVEYKVRVTGSNNLGLQGEEQQFSLQVVDKKSGATQLLLEGPSTTRSMSDSIFTANLISCENEQAMMDSSVKYEWKIDGELAQPLDLPEGKVLHLPSGSLQGGKTYNISCTATSTDAQTSKMLNVSAWLPVLVLLQGIQAKISLDKLVIGTGQPLMLDASQSLDMDGKPLALQYSWCCQYRSGTKCFLPRPGEPMTVENGNKGAFQQPILRLPPGSLPVGEYVFTVEVSQTDFGFSKAQSTVRVIPGLPPLINIPLAMETGYADPNNGVTIPAVITFGRAGCRMHWVAVHDVGYSDFDLSLAGLGDYVAISLEDEKDVMGREFTLVIPGSSQTNGGTKRAVLKPDALYKFRLSVSCPKQGNFTAVESYADVVVATDSPPNVKELKVTPLRGEALRTIFQFYTEPANDLSTDYPLQYTFGYYINANDVDTNDNDVAVDEEEILHEFSKSNLQIQVETTLPSGSAVTDTLITPVLKVCDIHRICTVKKGETLIITLPKNLTLVEVQNIAKEFSELLASRQYTMAQSKAKTSLMTLKQLSDQSLYTAAAEIIQDEIRKELKRKEDGLDANPSSIQSSLDFLEMSINVLSQLSMSGSTLQDLSSFRDKILSLVNRNNDLIKKHRSNPEKYVDIHNLRSRHRRSSSDAPAPKVQESNHILSMLKLSEIIINTGTEAEAAAEKPKLLRALHSYMRGLCSGQEVSKDHKIFIGVSILEFSVEKLVSEKFMLVHEFSIPERGKHAVAFNRTAFVSLPKYLSEKYGPSDSMCLGGVSFSSDYLTDVIKINSTIRNNGKASVPLTKNHKRQSLVYEVRLVNASGRSPKQLDQPIIIKIPLLNAIPQLQQLKCAVWQNQEWNANMCGAEEIYSVSHQQYLKCSCKYLGYFIVVMFEEPTSTPSTTVNTIDTTTTAITTTSPTSIITAVPTTTMTTPTASKSTTVAITSASIILTKPSISTVLTTSSYTTSTSMNSTVYPVSFPASGITTATTAMTAITTMATASPSSIDKPKVTAAVPYANYSLSVVTWDTTRTTNWVDELQQGVPVSNISYNVSFRIQEDYDSTVGDKKKEFEEKLREEILAQIEMPPKMIFLIEVQPGSIMVTLTLVDTDVKTAKEVIPIIAHILENGHLDLHGLDERRLNVPRQTITVVEPYSSDRSNAVVYGVVGSVLASALALTLLVVGAVVKKKKDAEKLRSRQLPSVSGDVPTYRQFQFEHSIEGTEASLARYRSNYPALSTAGTLMLGTVVGGALRQGIRYDTQLSGSQFLHPEGSYNVRKKRRRKQRTGSQGGLLAEEETVVDQDSGIDESYANCSEDAHARPHAVNRKKTDCSMPEFDVLPGTPTDD